MVRRGKLLKWMTWGVLGLLPLAIVAALLLPSFIDFNKYRDEIATVVGNRVGMRVELAGQISVEFFPSPRVVADQINLRKPTTDNDDIIARAKSLDMTIDGSDILAGRINPKAVSLAGLNVTMVESESGWKIEGIENKTAEGEGGFGVEGMQIRLRNSRLVLKPLSGKIFDVGVQSLHMEGALPKGPLSANATLLVEDTPLKIKAKMKPVMGRDEISGRLDVRLPSGVLAVSGRMGSENQIETARINFSGNSFGTAITSLFAVADVDTYVEGGRHPFEIDMQLTKDKDTYNLVSRRLSLAETTGTMDVTVIPDADQYVVDGKLRLAVLDLDLWGDMSIVTPATQEDSTLILPALGNIALNVEGLRYKKQLIRQLTGTIGIKPKRITLLGMKARLPGTSQVDLDASYQLEKQQLKGRFSLTSANPRILTTWQNIEIPENIAEGRFSTLEMTARDFALTKNGWSLKRVTGKVDAIQWQGAFSGNDAGLQNVQLKADKINLDGYWRPSATSGKTASFSQMYAALKSVHEKADVSVKRLTFKGRRYKNFAVAYKVEPDHLAFSGVQVTDQKDGKISLTGRLEGTEKLSSVNLVANYTGIKAALYSDQKVIKNPISGRVTISGKLDELRLSIEAKERFASMTLAGRVGLAGNQLAEYDLQGQLNHNNIKPVLGLNRFLIQSATLPAELNFLVKKNRQGTSLVQVTGPVGDGQLLSTVDMRDDSNKFDITYDHPTMAALLRPKYRRLVNEGSAVGGLIALKGSTDDGMGITIEDGSVSFGQSVMSMKALSLKGNALEGDVKLSNWVVPIEYNKVARPSKRPYSSENSVSYLGEVTLHLADISLLGQAITSGKARVIFKPDTYAFDFSDLKINDAAASLKGEFSLGAEKSVDAALSADKLMVAPLLTSLGYSPIISGDYRLQFSFVSKGENQQDFLSNMNGRGSLSGEKGELAFISPRGIVTDLNAAMSARSFLSGLRKNLSQGITPVDSLAVNWTMNDGALLLEQFQSIGTWGSIGLDGQIFPSSNRLSLKGGLKLAQVPDLNEIPVSYSGPIYAPQGRWQTKALQKMAEAAVIRRLRAKASDEIKARGDENIGPALSIFKRAADSLRKKKKAAEEAAKKEQAQNPVGQ